MTDDLVHYIFYVLRAAGSQAMRFCFRFMVYDVHNMPTPEET
jgi:hypothetical protein